MRFGVLPAEPASYQVFLGCVEGVPEAGVLIFRTAGAQNLGGSDRRGAFVVPELQGGGGERGPLAFVQAELRELLDRFQYLGEFGNYGISAFDDTND